MPISKTLRSRFFSVLSCLTCLCVSNARADLVTLKNGDLVTGSVVKKDWKNLTIKSDSFGVIATAWDQVESVRTDQPLNLVLQDGRTAQGTLTTAEGKVEIATQTAKLSVALADITAIRDASEQTAYERLQHPGWGQLWSGTGTVGLAGTAGNARTLTFTTGVNAARTTNTDKTSVYFNAIRASALVGGKNADTADAVRAGLGYNHNLTPRLFANVFNDWEYDKFQSLDLRFVLGGGLGFHALKTARTQLDVLGGADFNHARFSTPLTQQSAELFWGDDYAFKLDAATTLVQSLRMFDDPSHSSAFRINFDAGASTKVSKWLNWNVTLSDRYLNLPVAGRKTNDFLYTTGLGVIFAR